MFLYRVVNFKNINFLLLYCKYVHHFIIKHSMQILWTYYVFHENTEL